MCQQGQSLAQRIYRLTSIFPGPGFPTAVVLVGRTLAVSLTNLGLPFLLVLGDDHLRRSAQEQSHNAEGKQGESATRQGNVDRAPYEQPDGRGNSEGEQA